MGISNSAASRISRTDAHEDVVGWCDEAVMKCNILHQRAPNLLLFATLDQSSWWAELPGIPKELTRFLLGLLLISLAFESLSRLSRC